MALREQFSKSGLWLFRWRSLLPVVVMFAIILVIVFEPQDQSGWTDALGWQLSCVGISTLGLVIRILTVGRVPHDTSRRSTRERSAAEVNRTGMYSLVRHPVYLGNYLMWLGVALAPGVWWLAVLITLGYALYYERIMWSEEEFLRSKFGQSYLDWANATPAILPNFRLWEPANLSFSWRTVLRREYASAFALVVAFTIIGLADDYEARFSFSIHGVRMMIFGLSLLGYITLRFLKRQTRVLHIEGR
jgi:protein-S-isoprenylcysteine O-methyltransferase Ste14